jgi:hypothetical protein
VAAAVAAAAAAGAAAAPAVGTAAAAAETGGIAQMAVATVAAQAVRPTQSEMRLQCEAARPRDDDASRAGEAVMARGAVAHGAALEWVSESIWRQSLLWDVLQSSTSIWRQLLLWRRVPKS